MNTPYKLTNGVIVDSEDGQHIAELCDGATPEQGQHIVKCVNSHDELVDALGWLDTDRRPEDNRFPEWFAEAKAKARALLAKLEGGAVCTHKKTASDMVNDLRLALLAMIEDLENCGECFGTDDKRIEFMQSALDDNILAELEGNNS